MTTLDARDRRDAGMIVLTRGLQVALVAIGGYGLVRGSTGVIVNASGALAATFLPALLRRKLSVSLEPVESLWLTGAVFLHAAGILGPYQATAYWHYLTHALSGSVVAAAGYVTVRAVDRHAEGVALPGIALPVVVLDVTLAAGVLWEVVEFIVGLVGAGSVLTVYGVDDIATDLIFTGVGGLVAAVLVSGRARHLSRQVESLLRG